MAWSRPPKSHRTSSRSINAATTRDSPRKRCARPSQKSAARSRTGAPESFGASAAQTTKWREWRGGDLKVECKRPPLGRAWPSCSPQGAVEGSRGSAQVSPRHTSSRWRIMAQGQHDQNRRDPSTAGDRPVRKVSDRRARSAWAVRFSPSRPEHEAEQHRRRRIRSDEEIPTKPNTANMMASAGALLIEYTPIAQKTGSPGTADGRARAGARPYADSGRLMTTRSVDDHIEAIRPQNIPGLVTPADGPMRGWSSRDHQRHHGVGRNPEDPGKQRNERGARALLALTAPPRLR